MGLYRKSKEGNSGNETGNMQALVHHTDSWGAPKVLDISKDHELFPTIDEKMQALGFDGALAFFTNDLCFDTWLAYGNYDTDGKKGKNCKLDDKLLKFIFSEYNGERDALLMRIKSMDISEDFDYPQRGSISNSEVAEKIIDFVYEWFIADECGGQTPISSYSDGVLVARCIDDEVVEYGFSNTDENHFEITKDVFYSEPGYADRAAIVDLAHEEFKGFKLNTVSVACNVPCIFMNLRTALADGVLKSYKGIQKFCTDPESPKETYVDDAYNVIYGLAALGITSSVRGCKYLDSIYITMLVKAICTSAGGDLAEYVENPDHVLGIVNEVSRIVVDRYNYC